MEYIISNMPVRGIGRQAWGAVIPTVSLVHSWNREIGEIWFQPYLPRTLVKSGGMGDMVSRVHGGGMVEIMSPVSPIPRAYEGNILLVETILP